MGFGFRVWGVLARAVDIHARGVRWRAARARKGATQSPRKRRGTRLAGAAQRSGAGCTKPAPAGFRAGLVADVAPRATRRKAEKKAAARQEKGRAEGKGERRKPRPPAPGAGRAAEEGGLAAREDAGTRELACGEERPGSSASTLEMGGKRSKQTGWDFSGWDFLVFRVFRVWGF